MLPTFISRPVLNPADATDQQIKDALNRLPVAWNVTTETIPATDTTGTAILATLSWPSASRLSGYSYGMDGKSNHLAAALALLAEHGSDPVALLDAESTEDGYRFTFGPEGLD